MVRIAGGSFWMGTDSHEGFSADGEGPAHKLRLRPFFIDRTAVSNADFAAFVEDTGYRTEAEIIGWSFVFHLLLPDDFPPTRAVARAPWWRQVEGATWHAPEGPGSSVEARRDHPVVHVSWNDAVAYARWAGNRLPSEAEWEIAARGGLVKARYPWGDELTPGGEHRCNLWQGRFPVENTREDGFLGTAPVTAYPPNGFGLYNTAGNVWEWCADWFSPTYYRDSPRTDSHGAARRARARDPGRLVLVPGVLLQPLPGGGALARHPGQLDRAHGFPLRARRGVKQGSSRFSSRRERGTGRAFGRSACTGEGTRPR